MSNFSKGDVVRLKSGSPRMMIAGLLVNGSHYVVWTNNIGDLQSGHIDPALLEPDRQRHS